MGCKEDTTVNEVGGGEEGRKEEVRASTMIEQ